ncbi:hypothetical protein [Halobiforma nitratireducens]|uniref:Lipoprotein n=1 Tax=Halobiforma nitratireducens JCM 10879 TaxID=1227454 RepID=M0MIF2_9EURY|nr:hypothetical protein [Halobiforma nitratireducens]EMA45128.1 hypothetical protein C446_02547 [Halobiforma nitratireducens JCM 10879]
MDHTVTRRGVVALATVGLAGCLGSDENGTETDDGPDEPSDDDDGDVHDGDGNASDDGRDLEPPERDIEPDWSEAAAFRTWLLSDTVLAGNRRFDYTEVFPDDTDLGEGYPDVLDISTDTVDGHLIQSFTQVFLGSFDPEVARDGAEDADDLAYVDDYDGYVVFEQSFEGDDEETRPIAVGTDAVVVGGDYERRIDASHGEYERLEDADPEFTHLFRELPHHETVTAHYGPPAADSVDVDGIYLWGVSSESPMAEELTWKFVFAREEYLTDDVLGSLEGISGGVTESGIEGRTATVVGAPPEMP